MIEFVERPPAPGLPEERRALLETATNGHAIVIALNGPPGHRVQNTLRKWLETQGHVLHYKRSTDTYSLICWAEPKAPRKERKR